jgi:hypothetical protein
MTEKKQDFMELQAKLHVIEARMRSLETSDDPEEWEAIGKQLRSCSALAFKAAQRRTARRFE